MSVIYKYLIADVAHLPIGDVVLVASDPASSNPNLPTVWIRHDDPTTPHRMTLVVKATGERFNPRDMTHVGSAICGEAFVWHIFRDDS